MSLCQTFLLIILSHFVFEQARLTVSNLEVEVQKPRLKTADIGVNSLIDYIKYRNMAVSPVHCQLISANSEIECKVKALLRKQGIGLVCISFLPVIE